MAVDVSTPVFEGPFDLLLHLILKEQVDIHEVSLAVIVDAYLQEIERMQSLDLEVATEFLLIASTLVELKARRLLPGREDVDLDEELALWEERDLLLARLLECKTFKDGKVTSSSIRSIPVNSLSFVIFFTPNKRGINPLDCYLFRARISFEPRDRGWWQSLDGLHPQPLNFRLE